MSVTQQIKDQLDIVQYVQEYVPGLKRAGRYYKACCPFHSEKTPSFVVNPDTQTWRCFGACAEGGDVFSFAQKINGWSFPEALQELGKRTGIEVKKRSPEQERRDERMDKLRGMLDTAALYYHEHLLSDDPLAQKTLAYVQKKRGFTLETIREWQIGFAAPGFNNMLDALKQIGYDEADILETGMASQNDRGRVYDRFRNRLMIPIRDQRGRVIGFGARALDPDDNPKYLNSPQTPLFDKSSTLFGLDRAKKSIRDDGTAVIVEGYMDVIQAHQSGYTNVVAQMGTAMAETQLKQLVPRLAQRVILALDADDAGQNATRRSLEVAREALQADYTGKFSVDMRVLQIDGAKDPDDVLRETPDKWPEYIASALPIADFVIKLETARLDTNSTLQERQTVARSVLPILAASENNLYTQDNLQKLALRLRISEQDLLAWAQEIQQEEQAAQRRRQRRQAAQQSQQKPDPAPEMPPPFAEEGSASSSEPPPLFFGEGQDDPLLAESPNASIEDDDWLEGQPLTVPQRPRQQRQQFTTRSASRAAEAYCLRMLLLDFALLPQVNRTLRELAGSEGNLMDGPLRELTPEDFTQGEYRALFAQLQESLEQDDEEPLDYLRESLDESLLQEMESLLLAEPDHIHAQIKQRLHGEFADIWNAFERQVRPGVDVQADVVRRALRVRHQRLEREQQEIRFLLEDAQRSNDLESERVYFAQTVPTMRALALIQRKLQ
jgi:DNA primase